MLEYIRNKFSISHHDWYSLFGSCEKIVVSRDVMHSLVNTHVSVEQPPVYSSVLFGRQEPTHQTV
jgi:hypothetical protein